MSSFGDHLLAELNVDGGRFLHPALDAQAYVNDPTIADNAAEEAARRYYPQLGPQFVRYIVERFDAQDAAMVKALAKWSEKPQTFRFVASMNSDVNGNVGRAVSNDAVFLDPPPGWTFALHRMIVLVDGFNFGTPFNAAAAYWELRINDLAEDGGSLVSGAGSFPVARSWGTRDAPHVRDGELASLFVTGTGAFASKRLTVLSQGTMVRETEG